MIDKELLDLPPLIVPLSKVESVIMGGGQAASIANEAGMGFEGISTFSIFLFQVFGKSSNRALSGAPMPEI